MGNDYEKNINTSLQLSRWILKPMGAWPTSSELSKSTRYLYRFVNYVCYGIMLLLLVPSIASIILDVESTYLKIKYTGPLSFFIMAIIKYYCLLLHEEDIRKCIQCIESDWRTIGHVNDKSIMTINANFGKRLIIICGVFMFGTQIYYNMIVPLRAAKMIAQTQNVSFIPLNYPPPKALIDSGSSPNDKIIFTVHCFSTFLTHAVAVGACSLAALFVTHACGQMEIIMVWLQHLVDGREDMCKDVNGRLAGIVRKHVRIMSFIERVEQILQNISLVEVIGCTLNMCFVGYYFIMEWNEVDFGTSMCYILLLFSLTFNIFIFCYVGELITEQYQKVGLMAYMTDWYRLPGKKNLDLILIIAMSNMSFKLTAGNLIVLSIGSFADVVKTAVTYLNMLRTLTS